MTDKVTIQVPTPFISYLVAALNPGRDFTLQNVTLNEVRDKVLNSMYGWISSKKETVKLKISIPFAVAIKERLAALPLPQDAWLANEHASLHAQLDRQLVQFQSFYKSSPNESKSIEAPPGHYQITGKEQPPTRLLPDPKRGG